MPSNKTRTTARDTRFFTALENGYAVRAASAMAGYARRSVYRWRLQDTAFAARWTDALQMAGDLLEEEADRRGRDGYDVPVFYEGERCGTKRKYADGLLLARLKAIRPEQYRQRMIAPIEHARQNVTVQLRDFSLEDLVRRLLNGEVIDKASLSPRVRKLLEAPVGETGH